MKISTRSSFLTMALLLLFLLRLSLNAQHNFNPQNIYANRETHKVSGLCLLCGVTDPDRPVDNSSFSDYSTFGITVGLLGVNVEQTLIFPSPSVSARCDSLIIGIGSGNALLTVNLFRGITVETYNGHTPNYDELEASAAIIRLLDNNTRAEIILRPPQQFDRVKVSLTSSLVGLLDGLRIYYAYHKPGGTGPVITPAAPKICKGSSVTLTATAGGATIKWYTTPTGGTPIATGSTLTVTPSSTTTYYAAASVYYAATGTHGGCGSQRTPVTVTVTPVPAAPTLAAETVTVTSGGTATFTATAPAGATFKWYTTATGGTPVFTGNPFSTVATSSTSYYVSATVNDCEGPRTKANVIVKPGGPSCGQAPPSPIAYYPFDGNVKDSTGISGDGQPVGNFTYAPDSICKSAIHFPGDAPNSRITFNYTPPANTISIAFWAKPSYSPIAVISNSGDGSRGYVIWHQTPAEGFRVRLSTATGVITLEFGQNFNPYQWHHIVFTYDGATAKAYFNGTLAASGAITGAINYVGAVNHLGRSGYFGDPYTGKLDEYYLYDRAITAAEISSFYQSYSYVQYKSTMDMMMQATPQKQPLIQSLQFYPNPASNFIRITGQQPAEGSQIIITDMHGKQVFREIWKSNNIMLPASIPDGTYILEIRSRSGSILRGKVIISKH